MLLKVAKPQVCQLEVTIISRSSFVTLHKDVRRIHVLVPANFHKCELR